MATSGWPILLSMLVAWPGADGPPGGLPASAVVASATLSVHVEPDGKAIVSDVLRRGERVQVVERAATPGWMRIEPPPSSFSWVEQSAVKTDDQGETRVSTERAATRAGIAEAKLPGPPGKVLEKGDVVRLRGRRTIRTGAGDRAVTWLAIEPPRGEVRFVKADGLAWSRFAGDAHAERDATPASYEPPAEVAGLPEDVARDVQAIEAQHRSILQQPLESWRLDGVKESYDNLLKRTTDPTARAVLQERLSVVANHDEMGKTARMLQGLLNVSRRRDVEAQHVRQALNDIDRPRRTPFVAKGLLQASSREVEGRRVYALIGPEGRSIAYLDVPPGLDARPALAKRVGVRGSMRYDESLGARLIAVKDLEPLE